MKKCQIIQVMAASLALAALQTSTAQARVMLQYFEGKWETMERRMPDIFMAGYGALWLPPAARADSGDQSVGFDVYDRFDLGSEGRPTLYGTETGLLRMIRETRAAGIYVYFDTVYNHNGFSDGYRGNQEGDNGCAFRWEKEEGGYPGFIMNGTPFGLPYDLDFRNVCPSAEFPTPNCDSDPLNCRISSLIDINHDSPSFWIRHPADIGNSQNIPYQAVKDSNRRLYPDQDLTSPYGDGVKPFNTGNPMAGDPMPEHVNGMLQRYTQWMLEVNGVAGFRLDAVKHTPAGWFTNVFDFAAHSRGRDFWGRQMTPFSFGEHVTSDFGQLAAYHRKDGYGNRTVLDFPLKFSMQAHIGNPSGYFPSILGATFDAHDGNGQDGSAGVMFIQSHDNGFIGDPPPLQNVAYAHILSRKGFPLVYYNAREFQPTLGNRDFPNNNSRGDALGMYGNTITRLVEINNNFVNRRGGNNFNSLWEDADFIGYELNNTLVVGLCDRGDKGGNGLGYEERNVTLPGFRNVQLKELTGNAADPVIDPNNAIPDTINVPANGQIQLRVPSDQNANGVGHGKPYVMYSIEPPQGTLSVDNPAFTIAPDGEEIHEGYRRITPLDVVTGNTATVRLQITGGSIEDNALIRWNHGINVDGNNDGEQGIAMGLDGQILAGFENFTTSKSPRASGGTGIYTLNVNLNHSEIKEGYNYITVVAFVQRLEGLPPVFNTFRKVIYVDRSGPDANLTFPANADGTDDIFDTSYGFVVDNPDMTGNALHYFWNLPEGTNPVTAGLLNAGNKGVKTDRNRYRFNVAGLQDGDDQQLTIVLFEESGNYTVKSFDVGVTLPPDPKPDSFVVY